MKPQPVALQRIKLPCGFTYICEGVAQEARSRTPDIVPVAIKNRIFICGFFWSDFEVLGDCSMLGNLEKVDRHPEHYLTKFVQATFRLDCRQGCFDADRALEPVSVALPTLNRVEASSVAAFDIIPVMRPTQYRLDKWGDMFRGGQFSVS